MLLTQKKLNNAMLHFLHEMELNNIPVQKMVLFGSYAKGNPTENSDIDVAIWSQYFEGNRLLDTPKVAHVLTNFPLIQLHPFHITDTAATNPFIHEILKFGIVYK
jgi:uncharacterized protein